jgi:hypothetical protein
LVSHCSQLYSSLEQCRPVLTDSKVAAHWKTIEGLIRKVRTTAPKTLHCPGSRLTRSLIGLFLCAQTMAAISADGSKRVQFAATARHAAAQLTQWQSSLLQPNRTVSAAGRSDPLFAHRSASTVCVLDDVERHLTAACALYTDAAFEEAIALMKEALDSMRDMASARYLLLVHRAICELDRQLCADREQLLKITEEKVRIKPARARTHTTRSATR